VADRFRSPRALGHTGLQVSPGIARGLENRLIPRRAIDELLEWAPERRVVQTDGGYGDITRFRVGLEQRALEYVVQVNGSTSAHHVHATPR
jgi:DDE superfamily endonuclease